MPTALPASEDIVSRNKEGGFRLTGLHVLLILLGFFGLVATVNGVMIHYALSTFRGEVTKHPYEEGLAYNADIQEARAQAARGWKVEGSVTRAADGQAAIVVTARDAAGAPLTGLTIRATLAAPADMKRDRSIQLVDAGGGAYRGLVASSAGAWDLVLSASRDGAILFQSHNRITLE